MSESEESVDDNAVYQLIEDKEWVAPLLLLDQTHANELVDLISQREHSPLWELPIRILSYLNRRQICGCD